MVASARLDELPVDVDFVDVPVADVLQAVGRRIGAQAVQVGKVWYLGTLLQEDRGILVYRVSRLGGEQLQSFVSVMLSELGKVSATSDGVVVVADRAEVIQRIAAAFDQLESCPSDAWVVQLYVIGISDNKAHELGLDGAPVGELSARSVVGSAGGADTWRAVFGVNGVLRASARNEAINLMAEPSLVLVDGEPGEYQRGRRVPVARKAVSDSGTVSTTGYDYFDTGFFVRCTARDVGQGRGRLDVTFRESSIIGYVEESPIVDEEKANSSVFVESGRLALVCSVKRSRDSEEQGGLFGLKFKGSREQQRLMIWAIAYRTR